MPQKKSPEEGYVRGIVNDTITFEERLDYDKLTFMYLSLPIALIGQLLAALLLSAIQITEVEPKLIAVWLSVTVVMILYRYYHYFAFRNESEYSKLLNAKIWLHRFYTNVLISGVVWGSSAILIFPEDNLVNQMAIVLFLFAVSFTSMGLLASKKLLMLAFAMVMFFPIVMRFFFLEDAFYTNIGFIVLALMLIMILIANYFGAVINGALQNYQHFIELKSTHDKLKERFFSLFERAPVGIYYYDKKLVIQDLNGAFGRMNGDDGKTDMIGQNLSLCGGAFGEAHEQVFDNITGHYSGSYQPFYAEEPLYVDLSTVPMVDSSGEVTGGIAIVNDITSEMSAKEEILRNSYYDALTEIPNRTLMMDKLSELLSAKPMQDHHAALLFINIDNFRKFNETFGYNVGDTVLKQVAYKIEGSVRDGDEIARMGGDEFVVLIPSLSPEHSEAANDAHLAAQRVRDKFVRPLRAAGENYHMTVSIGIMLFTPDESPAYDILKRAQTAMYHAKKSGRNTVTFYDEEMGVYVKEQLTLRNELYKAIKNDLLHMHYQPQINIETGELVAAEALVRWNHAERGAISPEKFVTIAEESGLIVELESWIFTRVLQEMQAWVERLGRFPIEHIAINVSPIHFLQPNFAEEFLLLTDKYGIEAQWIEIELTESEIMQNIGNAIKTIETLKEAGITFSIDDFGTGYSSLAYLKQLPVDVLKIDQSFIMSMLHEQGNEMIVDSISSIAKKFGMRVLAEGVEDVETLELLRSIGCDFYQGYYGYKPMPMLAFEEAVNNHHA